MRRITVTRSCSSVLLATLSGIVLLACGPAGRDDAAGAGAAEDGDGDGWSTSEGDCNDDDPTVYPGAPELDDDLDNDCDVAVDDDLPDVDDDGDGFTNVEGDCDDLEEFVNPDAVEVNITFDEDGNEIPEGVDNDCDGLIDEGTQPCDMALNAADAGDFAKAIELCNWIESATYERGAAAQRGILPQFGSTYLPHAGASMAVLSTGAALAPGMSGWQTPNPGATVAGGSAAHPLPQGDPADGCGQADPAAVNDFVTVTLSIRVPINAEALAYDFNFMSAEFSTYVCTDYDDTFLAILESSDFSGNISFDDAGRPVTINIGFFDVCTPDSLDPDRANCTGNAELSGTGFESFGGTGWLHTIAPVEPGETITLTFHLFDEGDTILDSLVLIDNFQWIGVPVDGPITIGREHAAEVHADLARGLSIDEIRARF